MSHTLNVINELSNEKKEAELLLHCTRNWRTDICNLRSLKTTMTTLVGNFPLPSAFCV